MSDGRSDFVSVSISSSGIRDQLAAGAVAEAATHLGRDYALYGRVVRGDGRGRQIDFPTANLAECTSHTSERCLRLLGRHPRTWSLSNVNVGVLPTIGVDRPMTVEAHFVDTEVDCYDAWVRLRFDHRLRDEQQFADFTALLGQIEQDVAAVRSWASLAS